VGYFGDGCDVKYLYAGVAKGFSEDQAGFWAYGVGKSFGVSGVDKSGGNAKTRQGQVHHVVTTAVDVSAGHNVVSGAKEGAYRKVQGGLTAGGTDRSDPAF